MGQGVACVDEPPWWALGDGEDGVPTSKWSGRAVCAVGVRGTRPRSWVCTSRDAWQGWGSVPARRAVIQARGSCGRCYVVCVVSAVESLRHT